MSQISLVGAGPGPLELLTLRALQRLEAAEVVVYDRLVGEEILARMGELVAASDPRSLGWNPIQGYDAMSSGDDIVYSSFAFGYSNYARKGRARPIRSTTIAGPGPDPRAGALLGGAGEIRLMRGHL